ncbi:MAG: hypothetical protein HUK02_04180 [Bacteroidaceae bacterium]|nr:hypothetical protein [Bacteroidaceae bacterium]
MKHFIYSLLALLLLVSVPASAQSTSAAADNDTQVQMDDIRQRLAQSENPYGIRIEKLDILDNEPTEATDSATATRQRRTPALINENKAHKFTFSYMSLDGQKNPIRLSAVIYLQGVSGINVSGVWDLDYDKVLISCHPTVTSTYEAPSGGSPVDGDIKRMCDDDFLVVCPDYCGYGYSSYRQHPYLIHDVTSRNCIDAAMAAVDFVQNVLKIGTTHGEDLQTYIVGYSQGGATALACAKYLESDVCPDNVKNTLNLKETCCGDGPYSTIATVNQYLDWGHQGIGLAYPCVLPLIVAAAKDAYGNGCMRTVEIEDFFSEEFKATGIIDMIQNKSLSTADLNLEITKRMKDLRPVKVFSDRLINPDGTFKNNTNEYKCLMRAMEINELASGWTPQHKITFYHLQSDDVVPYANLVAVKNGIQKNNPDAVKIISPQTAHQDVTVIGGIFALHFYLLNPGLGSLLFNFVDPDQTLAAAVKGFASPDYDKINHATGGVLFYIDYIFSDYLRDLDDNSYYE